MNRRATLHQLLGKSIDQKARSAAIAVSSGLEPYTGPWEFVQAAHLLRRTMYGPNRAQIVDAVNNGLTATVSQLLNFGPMPDPPVHYEFEEDPAAPIGTTWVDKPYALDNFNLIRSRRRRSLYAWSVLNVYEESVSLREKLTLFWHNHFVTSDINDPKYRYDYITRLRSNALANFRELTKAMTIDPSMLRYLNGNQNTKFAPNENFARELLELFTIGKGPQVGPGDYTTFTEDDVVAMARILTGWRDRGFNDTEGIPIESYFVQDRHDTGEKELSPRFDNIVISNANENEYSNLIDIIFQQEEVAHFICRKIYRWFVFYEIPPEVETDVIAPMAQLLIDNDYEIAPVVEALFSSAHFYDEALRGCMIKNPWDYGLGLIKELGLSVPNESLQPYYSTFYTAYGIMESLQMQYFSPPNVAGWTAYYQAPAFYQLWINSVTLPIRTQIATFLSTLGLQSGDTIIPVDYLEILNAFENPFEVNSVIDEFIKILLPKDLTQNQKDYLKEILIPGLPDFEWNVEYSEYASDPENENIANGIIAKIKNLILAIVTLPEYQLS
jgi:hypothetical protein